MNDHSVDNASRLSTLHKLRHWLFRLCQSRLGQCLEQQPV
jgi:hypothetical protein